ASRSGASTAPERRRLGVTPHLVASPALHRRDLRARHLELVPDLARLADRVGVSLRVCDHRASTWPDPPGHAGRRLRRHGARLLADHRPARSSALRHPPRQKRGAVSSPQGSISPDKSGVSIEGMELTPQQLCDVEFSEQWRGYNRDQVDDFIERVAAAVSTLQDRLRKMTERAVRAEQRSQEGSEADGAARRTLVLAQRTADATVAEAKETAARLIAQAQEEARAIILAAEAANESMPAAQPTAHAEIADLEVTRSRLQADVASLESHVSDRRAHIKDLLGQLQRHVDEGLDWRIAQWP